MRVAITGASGLLGSAFVQKLTSSGHTVQVVDRFALFRHSPREIADLLSGANWLLHAAANTNVEQCETDIDACYRDNLLLTEILVEAAQYASVPLVYISSTGVYGEHETAPYAEYQDTWPTTHHHRSKLLGEQAVLRGGAGNLVIRTGWLFGGSITNPKNFVVKRIEEAIHAQETGGVLQSNQQQIGCPTYTHDVVERVLALIASGFGGMFNCVNEGRATRFEYVSEIVRLAGISINLVPSSDTTFNRKAKVSCNESAINWRMSELGFERMPCWKHRLASYIAELTPILGRRKYDT